MSATPKTATVTFVGRSGQEYNYSLYNSDVANSFSGWATTGTAGSGSVNFITAPEDMVLKDFSAVTGIADTTAVVLWLDDAPIRNTYLQWANVLNSLNSRAVPRIGIRGKHKIQFQQVA